ncbi:MAG TPA: type II toxin-antitoxin system RelE/ParE family toxin [Thermoanaerobaculia bacterium]|nr:type II toxin-antitoxin system RelE/ParE family toxin [Thermoanaerobaculia bacterium]
MSLDFHPSTRRELLKHKKWYSERSPAAAARFEREIDHAITRIIEGPERYPLTRRGRRRFVMLEFPFDVIYRIDGDNIQVMAIAHHSRRPEYWLRRS